jgi:hypothetical protein
LVERQAGGVRDEQHELRRPGGSTRAHGVEERSGCGRLVGDDEDAGRGSIERRSRRVVLDPVPLRDRQEHEHDHAQDGEEEDDARHRRP